MDFFYPAAVLIKNFFPVLLIFKHPDTFINRSHKHIRRTAALVYPQIILQLLNINPAACHRVGRNMQNRRLRHSHKCLVYALYNNIGTVSYRRIRKSLRQTEMRAVRLINYKRYPGFMCYPGKLRYVTHYSLIGRRGYIDCPVSIIISRALIACIFTQQDNFS